MTMTPEQSNRVRGHVPLAHGDVTGSKFRQQIKARDDNREGIGNSVDAFKQAALEMYRVPSGKVYAIPREVYDDIFRPAKTQPEPDDNGVIDYTQVMRTF